MKKVILFDLYATVLKDVSFSFDSGMTYVYDAYFKEACTLEEFKEYEATFLPLYKKRIADGSEVCLIKDEVPLFFEKFGVTKPDSYEELEYDIMKHMQLEDILEEVIFTLDELKKQGIKMYILSNGIYTGRTTMRLLNEFGILTFFEKVFSSADYGVRKPNIKFYQIAIDEIISDNPEVKKEDILYVGNDYITDATGATNAGLDTVWYNVNHLPNEKELKVYDIDDFRHILEIVYY